MARKRRKSGNQRRRPARSRSAARQRAPAPTSEGESGIEADAGVVTAPSATIAAPISDAAAAQPSQAVTPPPPAQASWPTRRKRSQRVDLPIHELDHVRSDLARIGLLSLGMVAVLVVLTVVLR